MAYDSLQKLADSIGMGRAHQSSQPAVDASCGSYQCGLEGAPFTSARLPMLPMQNVKMPYEIKGTASGQR
jgi:hypothetical protein